jgi:hypothetical protein
MKQKEYKRRKTKGNTKNEREGELRRGKWKGRGMKPKGNEMKQREQK